MARSASLRPFLLSALAALLLAPAPLVAQSTSPSAATRLEQLVDGQLAPAGFSGALLVRREGEVLLRRGVGLADREAGVENTPETVFRIGSVSKQFTATLVLRLAEKDLLDLDAPAGEYWIDCPVGWSEVTLRHLLGHTSGIPDVTDRDDYLELCLKPLRPADSLALVVDRPLEFEPGTRWAYSNSGYLLLALICETVGEKPFEVLLDELVIQPLGLAHTGSEVLTGPVEGMARAYGEGPDGSFQAGPPIDMNFPVGGGGMHSTVDDLARWLDAIDGRDLLSEASWDGMLREGLGHYAMGVMVGRVGGESIVHHGGSINGFESWVALFPERDLEVVVLSNLASQAKPELNAQRVGMGLAGLLLDPAAAGIGR